MRTLLRISFAVGVAALLAAPALAQQPPGRGGFGGGFGGGGAAGMIGFNRQLQEELKMDKEQVDKLTAAMAKVREDMADEFANLRDASPTVRAEIFKKMGDANTKAVNAVLKPEQIKRLGQIDN